MSSPLSTDRRDDVLRRVGRNIVNFQRLEALLRSLLPNLSGSGTAWELQAKRARLQRSLKKASLGRLGNAMHEELCSESLVNKSDASATEIRLAYSMRIEAPSSEAAERKLAFLKLVAARNRLIHRDLVDVDPDSPEECIRLSKQLDEQNEQIREQLRTFDELRATHSQAMSELLDYIQSEAFLADLEGTSDEA